MKPATCLSRVAFLGLLLLVAGCSQLGSKDPEPASKESQEVPKAAPAPVPVAVQVDKAQQELQAGIASYENGSYKVAARQLQLALAQGLEKGSQQARAHKYLAFMHCVEGSQRLCREQFRKAFEADPAFDLTPAEAGHPTWGPVFRKLKAAIKAGKK